MSEMDFAVVLAAGRSQRMRTDKAGMGWIEVKTLLAWTVASLKAPDWSRLSWSGLTTPRPGHLNEAI